MRSLHFWVVVALFMVFAAAYYSSDLQWPWLLAGKGFLANEYARSLRGLMFAVPMLYAAWAFRLTGAIAASIVVFLLVLSEAFAVPRQLGHTVGAIVPVAVASAAAIVIGREGDRRQTDKAALRDLDLARHELDQSARLLSASEARYKGLFSGASDGIFVRNLEGNIIEVNEAAAVLTGYSAHELAKMNVSQLLMGDSFRIAMDRQQALLNGKAVTQRYELELTRKDRQRIAIESSIGLLTADGRPVGVQALVRDVTQQKQLRENMQFYISEITKAQEKERQRIAHELHDETAQSLAVLSMEIEAVIRSDHLWDEAVGRLKELRARVSTIGEGVRRFSHELRPWDLEHVGLMLALESLVDELTREGRINARVEGFGDEQRLSREAELVLFRIAQEALRNVRKHSKATEVIVTVDFNQRHIKLGVTDNGCGFELPEMLGSFASTGKLGLIGMYERARLLNGAFSVKSQTGKGTTVSVEVPL